MLVDTLVEVGAGVDCDGVCLGRMAAEAPRAKPIAAMVARISKNFKWKERKLAVRVGNAEVHSEGE